jgi:hypothetical protein
MMVCQTCYIEGYTMYRVVVEGEYVFVCPGCRRALLLIFGDPTIERKKRVSKRS